jgi:hypothetical protein
VIRELPPHSERPDSDLGIALLEQLLPLVSNTLRSSPAGPARAPTASFPGE